MERSGESHMFAEKGGVASAASYRKLTPTMCLHLAAPHTMAGPAVLTTVFGGVYSAAEGYDVTPLLWCLLLAVAIFAQAAVNTINDWSDFVGGIDTSENCGSSIDSVLVYDNPDPRSVLRLGIVYICIALVCGIAAVAICGSAVPLVFGAVGAAFIICYSVGKVRVSYLPIGEICSGIVMGCLIPMADICAFASYGYAGGAFEMPPDFSWLSTFVVTIPFILGVGMIMFTNNSSDIERDGPAGRKTMPVLLGRDASVMCYRSLAVIWIASMLAIVAFGYTDGLWAAIVVIVLQAAHIQRLLANPLTPDRRGPSMGTVMKCNVCINGAYIVAIAVSMIL